MTHIIEVDGRRIAQIHTSTGVVSVTIPEYPYTQADAALIGLADELTENTPLVTDKRKFRCSPMVRAERAEAERDTLLAALKDLACAFVDSYGASGLVRQAAETCRVVQKARAAIAQAEGE